MKQDTYQVSLAGGVETSLPQRPENATKAQNLVIDPNTGGWSTRVGYEPFVVNAAGWTPFGSIGPVYSMHCAQGLAGGARQHILFESDGQLRLVYEAAGTDTVITIQNNRHIPTPTEAGSWYTDTPYGTVITNGVDRPASIVTGKP